MTKEEWQKIRKESTIKIDVFFEYYKETAKGILISNLYEFEKTFFTAIYNHLVVKVNDRFKKVDYESAIHRLYNYYDNKFGV